MKSLHQQRVEEFMRQAKQALPVSPLIPSEAVCLLRARLILEEALETVKALGVSVSLSVDGLCESTIEFEYLEFQCLDYASLSEIADGCADLSVVTIGTLSACGIPDQPILEAVDQNNLDKFGPGHSWDEHGKLIKPPNHKPPDLKRILEEALELVNESPEKTRAKALRREQVYDRRD